MFVLAPSVKVSGKRNERHCLEMDQAGVERRGEDGGDASLLHVSSSVWGGDWRRRQQGNHEGTRGKWAREKDF